MKPSHLLVITALMAFAHNGLSQEPKVSVQSITFSTHNPPPVWQAPPEWKDQERLFRVALATMPEGVMVSAAVAVGAQEFSLTQTAANDLNKQMTEVYGKIARDPLFAQIPSALPYCFSEGPPQSGHYFLYRPAKTDPSTPLIVLLHGYGGNFLWYLWTLKEAFPHHIILVPSWSVSWRNGSSAYLQDMLADAAKQLRHKLDRPWLMGVSDGGVAIFRIVSEQRDIFAGLISISAAPLNKDIPLVPRSTRTLMITGISDDRFPIATVRHQVGLLRRQVPSLAYKELDGDHFIFLSQRERLLATVKEFMNPTAKKSNVPKR